MSTFMTEYAARQRAEWDSHVRPEIRALAERGNVTWDEWQVLRANSYERETLYLALTDDALIRLTEYCLSQCQFEVRANRPAATYDDAVLGVLLPLVLQRLRERTG